jgi:transcriptional regulator with XRE-family HTH domain
MPDSRRGFSSDCSTAFGAALRALRLELGLSQESLASAAGLDRTYVGGLERGEHNPTLRVIWMLSDTLEVSPSELLRQAESRLG